MIALYFHLCINILPSYFTNIFHRLFWIWWLLPHYIFLSFSALTRCILAALSSFTRHVFISPHTASPLIDAITALILFISRASFSERRRHWLNIRWFWFLLHSSLPRQRILVYEDISLPRSEFSTRSYWYYRACPCQISAFHQASHHLPLPSFQPLPSVPRLTFLLRRFSSPSRHDIYFAMLFFYRSPLR